MRISKTQKYVLFVLTLIEKKQQFEPIESIQLFTLINGIVTPNIFDTNFRVSCHKLHEHGLIDMYRDSQSLKLSWCLSEEGRNKGEEIFLQKMQEINA